MVEMDKIRIIESVNNKEELKDLLSTVHKYDIAQIIKFVEIDKKKLIISLYDEETLVEIFSYLEDEEVSLILGDIDLNKAVSIINGMEIDNASDVLEEFSSDKVSEILPLLDLDVQTDLQEITKYEEGTAGSVMNLNYLEIYEDYDVKEAMKVLVQNAPNVEVINTLIVVDHNKKLVGTLDFKKLIVTKSPCKVNEIMLKHFESVEVNDPVEDVIKKINDYDLYLMPITEKGIMKGIITIDDAFDETINAAVDDYAKLAGLTEDEESNENVKESIKKRIPWLIILLFLDFGVSFIISIFSKVIVAIPLLAFFQAAVLGLAGNAGTQSLAVVIRKIGENKLEENSLIVKHLLKEMILGFVTGIILGITSFIIVVGMLYIKKEVEIDPLKVGLVLGVSIAAAVTVSNLFGALVPVIFYKCKADPAVASGPFITTINDIIVVILYFGIAMLILQNYL